MAKAAPGVLGHWSALDQHPRLWWELEAYADAEAREQRRQSARHSKTPRVAGRDR